MASEKDTIYIDIDDEITAIIDKVETSPSKIVALVLPKRATAMQSLVNMKLLRRAADDAGKNLVLVTSESGLMPLAGAAGLHVAATPTSKPAVPTLADASDDVVEDIDEPTETPEDVFDARKSENQPIGEVAGLGAAAVASQSAEEDPIELDNSEPLAAASPIGKKSGKTKKDKKLKVPNFKKFRLGALLAILAIIGLGVLFYFALEVWPHATIKIFTSQQQLPLAFTANLDSGASSVNTGTNTIPAIAQTSQKSYSQTVPATGQKDEGTPATGSVVMTMCATNSYPSDVPAGTGISTNNLTYITQQDASFSPTFKTCAGGSGVLAQSNTVDITAQSPGSNYNVSSATFSVSGSSATATGSASGGTSNIVRVVQQSDIDSAKQQLTSQANAGSIKQSLESQLSQNGVMALPTTYAALPSNQNSSANAGDQADNVTVTENVTYVMFGASRNNLDQLVKANAKNQMNSNQGVLETGLDQASFSLTATPSASTANVKISTTAIIGPKLDTASIKSQAEGKKAGDVKSSLAQVSGVSKVEVDLSPFWVGSVPKDANKITVDYIKANGS